MIFTQNHQPAAACGLRRQIHYATCVGCVIFVYVLVHLPPRPAPPGSPGGSRLLLRLPARLWDPTSRPSVKTEKGDFLFFLLKQYLSLYLSTIVNKLLLRSGFLILL